MEGDLNQDRLCMQEGKGEKDVTRHPKPKKDKG